jgi:hypothetical protein
MLAIFEADALGFQTLSPFPERVMAVIIALLPALLLASASACPLSVGFEQLTIVATNMREKINFMNGLLWQPHASAMDVLINLV